MNSEFDPAVVREALKDYLAMRNKLGESESVRCQVTGKIQHKNATDAERQLDVLLLEKPNYTGRPYVCDACGDWHIGRATKSGKSRIHVADNQYTRRAKAKNKD